MYEPLLSPAAVAEIQNIARGQFNTPVLIFRPHQVSGISDPDYNPSYDFGDSGLTDPVYDYYDGGESSAVAQPSDLLANDGSFSVWFLSRLGPDISTAEAQMSTISIHVVRAPVGSNILTDDIIRVVASGEEYTVVDSNNDDSWPEMMKMIVRNRE